MTYVDPQRLADAAALRVRYWMAGVRQRLRPTSLDDLGRLVEPELRWRSELTGELSKPNKWRAYDKGDRSPRMSLIDKVEAMRLPNASGAGSKAEFTHVLWNIIQDPYPTPQTCRRWMWCLDTDIQAIANRAPVIAVGRRFSYGIPKFRLSDYESLRHRPGLDALAVLIFVVQQAHRFGQIALANEAGVRLVSAVWQCALRLEDRELLHPFVEYLENWVMPMTQRGNLRLSFGDNISERATILRNFVHARAQRSLRATSESDIDVEIRRVISGAERFELRLMYMAATVGTEVRLDPGRAE